MSTDYMVYIGPYLEVTVDKRKGRRDRCRSKENCPNPTGRGFCPKCGIRLPRHEEFFWGPDWKDILSGERLAQSIDNCHEGNVYRLTPNLRDIYSREFDFEPQRESVEYTYPGDLNPQAEREWFEKTFAPEIAALVASEVVVSYRLLWGVFNYSY